MADRSGRHRETLYPRRFDKMNRYNAAEDEVFFYIYAIDTENNGDNRETRGKKPK